MADERLEAQMRLATQHAKRAELFLAIVKMSHEDLSFEEQLKYFIQYVCEMSGWPLGHVYLPDDSNNETLYPTTLWNNLDKQYEEFRTITEKTILEKGTGLLGRVFKSKKSVWMRDATTDPYFTRKEAAEHAHLKSAFATPIFVKDKIIAICEFFFKGIAEEDLYLLESTEAGAKQLSLAIEKQQQALLHQEKLANINKQLVSAARRAGMAEIASSVLHNVANIVNSVNIASHSLKEKLNETQFNALSNVAELIQAHKDNLNDFLNNDPQGKNVIDYITKIHPIWERKKTEIQNEIKSINKNVENIKDIIAMQQTLNGANSMLETIPIVEIVEEALALNSSIFPRFKAAFRKEYMAEPTLLTDKVKVLQILVNLLRNACESTQEMDTEKKPIDIKISTPTQDEVCIEVMDQGKGIVEENLSEIFTYGFTTKKYGHGIGLHISALAAKELGGSLSAKSPGENQGATFTLSLPLKPTRRKEDSL